MKILIAGESAKALEMASTLANKTRRIYIISPGPVRRELLPEHARHIHSDPGRIRLSSLGVEITDEDVLMVVSNDPLDVRRTIHNLRAQASAPDMVVISEDATLRSEFPELLIRSGAAVYREELNEVLKRVHTRKRLAEIKAFLRLKGRALILIWGNPDPDAIASAYALRHLIQETSDKITIAYLGEFTRPENKAMVDTLEIPTQKFEPAMLEEPVAVFTVDAQPSFFRLDVPIRFDAVIDHHPKSPEPEALISDIRPSYGSTSTILTEYFIHSRAKIPKRIATALWYGLKTDTSNLTRNVGEADIRAFRLLKTLADEDVIRSIELSQMPLEVLDTFGQAIASKEIWGETVFSYLGSVANADYAVYVADFFLRVWKISVSIVAAQCAAKLVVVLRSDGLRHDVGRIAERAFSTFGTAGGHRTMARAEMDLERVQGDIRPGSDEKRWLADRLLAVLKPASQANYGRQARTDAA